jgi:hypothetical protein
MSKIESDFEKAQRKFTTALELLDEADASLKKDGYSNGLREMDGWYDLLSTLGVSETSEISDNDSWRSSQVCW